MSDEGASLLERLGSHLKAELTVHQHLLKIAERKRDEIVSGDITAFSRILEQEQAVLAKGHELSRIRNRILVACAQQVGEPIERLRMAQILERAPEPLRSELSGLQDDLRSLLMRLRDINDRNMVLIRQSLNFVRDIMQIVTGQQAQRQDYGRSGTQDETRRNGGGILNREA